MGRKVQSSKKQTRLAFAPAVATLDGSGDDGDRYRTLSYQHPSLPTIRSPRKSTTSDKSSSHRSSRSKQEKVSNSPKSLKRKPTLLPQTLDDTSSEDEIVVRSAQKKRARVQSPDIPDEEPEETPRPRRKLKRKSESSPVINLDSDDSDDEPVLSSPIKRRRITVDVDSPKTPRASANVSQDELDIKEDVRDLQDSVLKTTRTRGRVTESARDKRFKTLEAIRRKRAGQKAESEDEEEAGSGESDEEGSPSKHGRNRDDEEEDDDDDDDDDDNDEDEDDVEEEEDEQPNLSNEDLDRYDDDFVLDDENTPLGVPTDIPFEFTRHAYKKPKDYFRDVVGWMIHNRLDPAFPRSDDMYKMAFMKLEDEVKGRAGSQLISSVWNADFCYALLARPHIEITAYPTDDCHSCDACKRSGHPASSDMKLYGKPYSLETLEPLNDNEEDQSRESNELDSNENSGDESDCDYDRNGRKLPDENRRFLLGRQCKHKAQLAHTLTHWRFHLNEWVVDYLERMGHMADEEVLRRNNMSQKRKTRNAIKVLDSMITAGEVEKLWRDFHTNLKTARGETVRP
ncbi:hypothetical protein N7493_005643 [Penicillium malachiteum]|uniref:DUF4211 domain-containing protein n=1 Tax=Penicillium malachiteum TaxID=1324776 RepID=A0AAD6HNC4_9EURO|nr:hypothetical protein N7493_005643 [Penicillium malachiteum]